MGLKILDIPAYTEASSTEALVSYTLCTPPEPEMIVLAAWRGPGFRMAVGVTGSSASVHHSSVMSHHPNMEGAKGRPSFVRESAVWLEGPKTQLFLCSFFTTLLSNSPTFSMGSHYAGEDSKLAPHLHTLLHIYTLHIILVPWANTPPCTCRLITHISCCCGKVHVQINIVIF